MRTCPACAAPNQDESRFCAQCGARLPVSIADAEQRKTVTILFADIAGSTALGERMEPEVLRRMLSRFFEVARAVVESHGGTVEKFIGDAVVAIFGVPVLHEDDALRAMRTALDLMGALQSLNVDLARDFGAGLQIRVGVNTGDVVTGTSERLATGVAVNVAARLEQLAPPGGIYVGELTVRLAGTLATVEEIEPTLLKGTSAPARVFRLLAVHHGERPAGAAPMIGRDRQLEMLRGAFRQAVEDDSCVLFTLLGPAGVGKSRLCSEFLEGLDATVLRARCLSYGSGIGLWPAVDVVRQLQRDPPTDAVAALLDRDPSVAAAVRSLVDSEGVASPATEISWAVRRLLEASARVRPLVMVLDDLHWAEEPLFELVEHVTTLSRDAPILVLVLARPELVERRRGWGVGSLNASTVLLEPLGLAETATLIESLATTLDAAAQIKVQTAAAGNPLFAEEMVALVEASGGADVQVPPTIQALLAARLDQLDPAEQRALERGSVEGQSFHRRGLTALGIDQAGSAGLLLGLVRKDLIRPDRPTLDRDDAYRFRHLLLRDAAYDRLPKSIRADLHERFARWLDEQTIEFAERDNLVGYHLEQAYHYLTELGPLDEAARQLGALAAERLETAGRRQMQADPTGAIGLLERAGALNPRVTPDVSLELGIASVLLTVGRPVDAAARAADAAEAADRVGDIIGAQQARLNGTWFEIAVGSSTIAEMQTRLATTLPTFEAAGADAALAWAWWAAMLVAHSESRYADALEAQINVTRYAKRSADPYLNGRIEQQLSALVFGPTPIPRVLELLEAAREHHDLLIDSMSPDLLAYVGRFDEAHVLFEQSLAALLDRGMRFEAAIMAQTGWCIAMAAGDPETATAIGRESCTQLEAMGERSWMSTSASQVAESLYAQGHVEEAAEWVQRALDLGDADDATTQAQARMVRAMVNARHGDRASALRDVSDVLDITAKMQAPQDQGERALNAAHVFLTLGDRDAAETQARAAVDYFTAKGSTVYAARAAGVLAELTAAS